MTLRLHLTDVTVERGGLPVLQGLSVAVEGGAALVIRGPNGAGKSTLLRAIAGYVRVQSGEIALTRDGANLDIGENAHSLGHLNATSPAFSVRENLEFMNAFLDGGISAVGDALARLNLVDLADIPVKLLSAGQKRRVGLARLIVAQRPLWLLDEPTTSLDSASTRIVESLIAEHLAGGGVVLVATHTPLEAPNARHLTLSVNAPVEDNLEALA